MIKASNMCVNLVMGMSLIVVTVTAFAQVVSRYSEFSTPWSSDIIRMAFIYLIFSGAAVASREGAHISIDLLDDILPARLALLFNAIAKVLIICILVFLLWFGFILVSGAGVQRMPYLDVPISYVYFAIPLFTGVMLLYQIGQLVELFRRALSERENQEDQEAG